MNVRLIVMNKHGSVLRTVLAAGFLLISGVAAAQEENPLPAPTGPHEVGVAWRHWVDESRDEPYDAETSEAKREMIVGFYYPAEPAEGAEPADYFENRATALPTFAMLMEAFVAVPVETQPSDLDHFESYAYHDAPLSDAEEAYPVLIFSHGATGDMSMYTFQIEELASHGYIVVAINHAYGTAEMILLDGTVAVPTFATGLDGAAQIWSEDQIFVIDQLEALNTDDPDGLFTGRLDLERLGLFGHSLGASTSTLTCLADQRCKAVASEDGQFYGAAADQGLEQPYMLFRGVGYLAAQPNKMDQAKGPFYQLAFADSEHLEFTDLVLWPNNEGIKEASWLGTADPLQSIEMTRASLVAFFDQYVKGSGEGLLDTVSAYPAITVTTNNVE
jgi:pimeloyl-ACP methyl ester carboxylesterase